VGMKTNKASVREKEISQKEIAKEWGVHVSAVAKIMRKYGISGRKNSPARGSRRTYLDSDVHRANQIRAIQAHLHATAEHLRTLATHRHSVVEKGAK
jgi:transposase